MSYNEHVKKFRKRLKQRGRKQGRQPLPLETAVVMQGPQTPVQFVQHLSLCPASLGRARVQRPTPHQVGTVLPVLENEETEVGRSQSHSLREACALGHHTIPRCDLMVWTH